MEVQKKIYPKPIILTGLPRKLQNIRKYAQICANLKKSEICTKYAQHIFPPPLLVAPGRCMCLPGAKERAGRGGPRGAGSGGEAPRSAAGPWQGQPPARPTAPGGRPAAWGPRRRPTAPRRAPPRRRRPPPGLWALRPPLPPLPSGGGNVRYKCSKMGGSAVNVNLELCIFLDFGNSCGSGQYWNLIISGPLAWAKP